MRCHWRRWGPAPCVDAQQEVLPIFAQALLTMTDFPEGLRNGTQIGVAEDVELRGVGGPRQRGRLAPMRASKEERRDRPPVAALVRRIAALATPDALEHFL